MNFLNNSSNTIVPTFSNLKIQDTQKVDQKENDKFSFKNLSKDITLSNGYLIVKIPKESSSFEPICKCIIVEVDKSQYKYFIGNEILVKKDDLQKYFYKHEECFLINMYQIIGVLK